MSREDYRIGKEVKEFKGSAIKFGGASVGTGKWYINILGAAEEAFTKIKGGDGGEKEFEKLLRKKINQAVIEEVSHAYGDWDHYLKADLDKSSYLKIRDYVISFLAKHREDVLYVSFNTDELFIVVKRSSKMKDDLENLYSNLRGRGICLYRNFEENNYMYGQRKIKEIASEITV